MFGIFLTGRKYVFLFVCLFFSWLWIDGIPVRDFILVSLKGISNFRNQLWLTKREKIKCQYQEWGRGHHSEPTDIKETKREYYKQLYASEFDSLGEMRKSCVRILIAIRFSGSHTKQFSSSSWMSCDSAQSWPCAEHQSITALGPAGWGLGPVSLGCFHISYSHRSWESVTCAPDLLVED